jgi:hypothetical protein
MMLFLDNIVVLSAGHVVDMVETSLEIGQTLLL